jgi:phage/plasmid-associated DNA primase
VTEATDAYLESEDALVSWFEEQCVHDSNGWEKTTTLFAAWKPGPKSPASSWAA